MLLFLEFLYMLADRACYLSKQDVLKYALHLLACGGYCYMLLYQWQAGGVARRPALPPPLPSRTA